MKTKPLLSPFSILITVILLFVILSSTVIVFADSTDVVDQINVTVPVSCTMSGTGMTSHNADISNGTYQADIGTTTLTAYCNDNSGFAIYAAGYTGNEIGETNSNKLVGTSASGNATIVTGTATSAGDPDISNWAMKLTMTQDSGDTTGANAFTIDNSFNAYHTVPNEYTKVAHKNAGTDMTSITGGVKLTTTYAVYISKTQPADTYSGQVIYTLVHPSYANAEGCNPSGTTISTILCMQDVNTSNKSTILASMTEEQQYTLKDKRDGKTYTVAKLKDGNIWMTQNLDLDLDENTTYTNLDTDLGWNESTSSYDTASWTPERSTYTTGNTTWGLYDSATGEHGGWYHPESYDPGNIYWNGTFGAWSNWNAYYDSCTYDNTTWVYTNCDESLNPIDTFTTLSDTPVSQYQMGNYYNWTAAIASNDSSGYGVYDGGTDSYANTESSQSICPAGWTLPIGGYLDSVFPDKSFRYLLEQYDWNYDDYEFTDDQRAWESPFYLSLPGEWSGIILDVGSAAVLWSSTIINDDDASILLVYPDGYVDPENDYYRYEGVTVRCVAR